MHLLEWMARSATTENNKTWTLNISNAHKHTHTERERDQDGYLNVLERKAIIMYTFIIIIIVCMQSVSLIIKVERNDVNLELGHSFAGLTATRMPFSSQWTKVNFQITICADRLTNNSRSVGTQGDTSSRTSIASSHKIVVVIPFRFPGIHHVWP